jgi:hypothetical protein
MDLFEEFTHLCHLNQIPFWVDVENDMNGLKHSNEIPQDFNCGVCLTKENYAKLLRLFENDNKYTVANLFCNSSVYNDPNGCCRIVSKKYLNIEKNFIGIDCISYEIGDTITKTLISHATSNGHSVTPSTAVYLNNELFPLKSILLAGNFVLISNKSFYLMKDKYGGETYVKYPTCEYNQKLENNLNKLFLLCCSFKTLPEIQSISNAVKCNSGCIIRNTNQFHFNIQELKETFSKEPSMTSWMMTKDDLIIEDNTNSPKILLEKWENNELTTSITNAPGSSHKFITDFVFSHVDNLAESFKRNHLSYVLTHQNKLTRFHTDVGGSSWVYLIEGKKLWWFITPEDIDELKRNKYPIESLYQLSFTELVFINNNYLWGKIYVLIQDKNDLLYLPDDWAHRVFTYDKAFGIDSYTS